MMKILLTLDVQTNNPGVLEAVVVGAVSELPIVNAVVDVEVTRDDE